MCGKLPDHMTSTKLPNHAACAKLKLKTFLNFKFQTKIQTNHIMCLWTAPTAVPYLCTRLVGACGSSATVDWLCDMQTYTPPGGLFGTHVLFVSGAIVSC